MNYECYYYDLFGFQACHKNLFGLLATTIVVFLTFVLGVNARTKILKFR